MKPIDRLLLSFVLPLFCVFLISGCAQNQQAIARLEQENAQQRERIWQSNRKMEDFRQENEALRQQLAALQEKNRISGTSAANFHSTPSSIAARPDSIVQPIRQNSAANHSSASFSTTNPKSNGNSSMNSPMNITPQPPAATLGTPSTLENQTINPPSGARISMENHGKTIRVRKTDSRNVHSISILPQKARKIDTRGIHAEFQMKDSSGNIVLAAAPISVMITDPSLPENHSRISEWKYSAEDIADVINSGQAAITIPLNMEWANSCPQNPNLELHILYYTSDKRILMHRARIDLTPRPSQATVSTQSKVPSGGLILGNSNPSVGSNAAQASPAASLSRPEWSPEP